MKRTALLAPLLALCALLAAPPAVVAATATTAAAPPAVSVTYVHPEQFTETRKLRTFAPQLAGDDYLVTLKRYIEQRASKLVPPGEHLAIAVTDVDRAGNFEPWRPLPLRDVRIVKDIYPPRIDLKFQLLDAHGKVLREGTRTLRDPGFLAGGNPAQSGPLRYEKALIDRWLAKGLDRL